MPAAAGHIDRREVESRHAPGRAARRHRADGRHTRLAQAQQPPMRRSPAPMAMSGAGARGAKCSSADEQREQRDAEQQRRHRGLGQVLRRSPAGRGRSRPSSKWMPSSFGSWSTTMTRPMPDLKPVSTGSEMKLATKPSRSSDASASRTPTSTASVAAAAISSPASPPGATRAELRRRQDRDRRRGADAERPRGAEHRVDDHRHDRGVQADLDRQPGDGRVGHRLRHHDRRRRQPGKHVEPQPRRLICPQPCDRGNRGRRQP